MAKIESLDAHERPPTFLRHIYKSYRKLPIGAVDSDPQILDFNRGSKPPNPVNGNAVAECGKISKSVMFTSCCILGEALKLDTYSSIRDVVVYEAKDILGQRSGKIRLL